MSNIRGLYDNNDDVDDEEKRRRDANNRFVGGIGSQGGGSGLAVEPNNEDGGSGGAIPLSGGASESIFNMAEQAGPDDAGGEATRRTITMYRDGFVVDDGPYRRLDDPSNSEFLTYLARGQTPRELLPEGGGGNITVGLIDKRKEEYVETFRSFSGAGTALGSSAPSSGTSEAAEGDAGADNGVFDPSSLTPPESQDGETTSIAVRMLDGKRKVIKVRLDATLVEMAALAVQASNSTISTPFRIVSGFPPKPIPHPKTTSVRDAGLKGAQIQLQKA